MKFRTALIPLAALAVLSTATWATATWTSAPWQGAGGDGHELLKRWEGTWEAECEMAMMPGEAMHATEVHRLLGTNWLVGDFKGEFMGAPFEGHSVTGWDAEKKVYTQIWIDSMSANMSTSEGTFDAEKGVLSFEGEGFDMMGQPVKERSVTTFESDDAIRVEMFQGGAPFMTIEYTRKKEEE